MIISNFFATITGNLAKDLEAQHLGIDQATQQPKWITAPNDPTRFKYRGILYVNQQDARQDPNDPTKKVYSPHPYIFKVSVFVYLTPDEASAFTKGARITADGNFTNYQSVSKQDGKTYDNFSLNVGKENRFILNPLPKRDAAPTVASPQPVAQPQAVPSSQPSAPVAPAPQPSTGSLPFASSADSYDGEIPVF